MREPERKGAAETEWLVEELVWKEVLMKRTDGRTAAADGRPEAREDSERRDERAVAAMGKAGREAQGKS